MRKKELEKISPKLPSQEMISTAAGDKYIKREYQRKSCKWHTGKWEPQMVTATEKSYATRFYCTAKEENGILALYVNNRENVAAGSLDPLMTVYIDPAKEGWITLIGGKWSKALLYNLIYDNRPHLLHPQIAKDVFEDEDLKLINDRLDTEEDTPLKAVRIWQEMIRGEENVRKAERKAEYWKRQMDKIPPLPDGFDKWIEDKATLQSNFIFYRKKGRQTEAYCTHCGNTFTTRVKMKHNVGLPKQYDYQVKHEYMCPNCNAILATKAWGKHKELETRDHVIIMQLAGEYVAFSKFSIDKRFRRCDDFPNGEKWKSFMMVKEMLRVLANRITFESEESYEVRTVPLLKRDMWAEVKESGYNYSDRTPMNIGDGILYTDNLEEVLKETSVKPIVAELFLKRSRGYPQGMFKAAAVRSYVEYMIKAGLTRLAIQTVEGQFIGTEGARNLKELLGIDGQQLHELKQVNGNKNAVQALQYVKKHGEKLNRDTLIFISNQHVEPSLLNMHRTHMSLQRTVNYIAKQARELRVGFHDAVRLYNDYLSMAFERGMDLTDDIVRHTPKLKEMHDRYLEEKNMRTYEEGKADLNAKFKQIAERHRSNAEHFRYERSGLVIMVPTCAADIKLEGILQHHCVGASDTYMGRMNRGESYILFLRKKEDPWTPYYTLEVDYDGNVKQSYGAYDRKPDWEQVEPVLMGFTRKIGQRTEKELKTAALMSAAG